MKLLYLFTILSIASCNYSHTEAQLLIPFLENSLYGFSDINGNLIIKPQFDEVDFFDLSYSYAQVKIKDKWHVVNRKGELLEGVERECKFEFDSIRNQGRSYSEYYKLKHAPTNEMDVSNIIALKKSCSCGDHTKSHFVFNAENFVAVEILPTLDLSSCVPNFERNSKYINGYLFALTTKGTYEVYDKNLNFISESTIEPEFVNPNEIYLFNTQGYLYNIDTKQKRFIPFQYLSKSPDENFYIFCKNLNSRIIHSSKYLYGICDKRFNILIDSISKNVQEYNDYFIIHTYKPDYATHLISKSGKFILEDKKYMHLFSNGVLKVTDTLGCITLYDKEYNIINEYSFDDILWNGINEYHYNNGNLAGILDSNFTTIFEYPADMVLKTKKDDLFQVTKNRKKGIVNRNKKIVLPIEYRDCYTDSHGFIKVKSNKTFKNGLANSNGHVIIDTLYDRINYDSIGSKLYIKAKKDRKWAYFNTDGIKISDFEEDTHDLLEEEEKRRNFSKLKVHWIQNGNGKTSTEIFKNFVLNNKHMNPNSIMILQKSYQEYHACKKDLTFLANCSDNKAAVRIVDAQNELLAFKTDEGQGIVNFENEIILPVKKRKIYDLTEHTIIVREKEEYIIYDLKMNEISSNRFTNVQEFWKQSPLRWVSQKKRNGKLAPATANNGYYTEYGYIDKYGKIAFPVQYSTARKFEKGLALVCTKDANQYENCSIIDTLGNVMKTFKPGVRPLDWSNDKQFLRAKKNDNEGYINKNGEVVIDFKYKSIESVFWNEVFKVVDHEGNSYHVNLNGNVFFTNTKLWHKGAYGSSQNIKITDDLHIVFPDGDMQIVNFKTGEKQKRFKGDNVERVEYKEIRNEPYIKAYVKDKYYYINPANNVTYTNIQDN